MWGSLIFRTPFKAMQILTFNNITRPYYEGGLTIDCRPQGKFLVEVRRRDGTIRRPFGDHLIENTFLNAWRDGQMGGTGATTSANVLNAGFSWSGSTVSTATFNSWLDLFYGTKSKIAVGSGSNAATASNTALQTEIRDNSSAYAGGNTVTWSQSTGDVVYTIKEEFPPETGTVTYREAGIKVTALSTSDMMNGLASGASRLINRVVFPADVTLNSGEALILTIGVTVPTLGKTTGKTITISAQNGLNISGELRLISSESSLVGGTVTGAGVRTANLDHTMLWSTNRFAQALLSNKTAFDAQGTNHNWGSTGVVTGVWSSYTNGQYFRDYAFTWPSGTPATNTDFRSILMRPGSAGAMGGYHLLLNNQMTKATLGALSFALRFSV
jgi:hypothetical protein